MSKIEFVFDPFEQFDVEIKDSRDRKDALSEIADYVKTESLQYVGDGKTPVKGGSFKKSLSKDYKSLKEKTSGVDYANLELHGDMLDALEARVTGNKITYGISGSQADKADGHNNFSGKSKLPPREFIPNSDRGQTFRSEILSGVKEILLNYGAKSRKA